MTRRRRSSTLVRRDCYDYWVTPSGHLICYLCGRQIDPRVEPNGWEAEHDLAHNLGGSDYPPNVKPACSREAKNGCKKHQEKTKQDTKVAAKTERVRSKSLGFKRSSRPMPGSKRSGWKRKFNGEVVRRR